MAKASYLTMMIVGFLGTILIGLAMSPTPTLLPLYHFAAFIAGSGLAGFAFERRLSSERKAVDEMLRKAIGYRRTGSRFIAKHTSPEGDEVFTGNGVCVPKADLRPDVVEAFENGRLTNEQMEYLFAKTSTPEDELN